MKTSTHFNLLFASVMVSVLFLSCNSTKVVAQKPNGYDYFDIYLSDVERDNLRGSVKEIKDSTFYVSLKFGEIIKGTLINNNCKEYDTNGRITKDNDKEYRYIDKDSILMRETYVNGVFESYRTTTFNMSGKKTKVHYFSNDNSLIYLVVLKYSGDQLLSEIATYGKDGNIETKYYDLEYDTNSCIIRYKFGSGVTLTWGAIIELAYDKNCHLTSEKWYTNHNSETVRSKENGNLRRSLEYVVDSLSGELFSKTNKEYTTFLGNNVIREEKYFQYRHEGDWIEKRTIEYGYITKTVTSCIEKQELIYDTHNNFVKLIKYNNEVPIEMTVRHIKYYE